MFVSFIVFVTEEPTTASPYEGTWYDDYDEYGMSMRAHIHTHTHATKWNKFLHQCSIFHSWVKNKAGNKIKRSITFQIYNCLLF